MEKEKNSNIEMLSDVIKNGVEAGIKIATKHYHMITDLQQLLFEKDKVFRMLGEQVFHMIDQGRIFAPAIMQTTFRAAKEIIERIAHLEEERKENKKEADRNSSARKDEINKIPSNGKNNKVSRSSAVKKVVSKNSKVVKRTEPKKNIKKKTVMKKKK